VSATDWMAHMFHKLMSDTDISYGRCRSIALVLTPLNSRMRRLQKRQSEGTYTHNTLMVFVANAMAIDGDPQYKMENASDRDGIGDEPTAPMAGLPNQNPLHLSAIFAVSVIWLETASDSRPQLLSLMLAAALIISLPVFFFIFYARFCQKNLKPHQNAIRALVDLVTARHGREAKGAKRVNVQYLLVLL